MRKSTPKRTTALARSVAQPLIVLRDATDRFIDDHELQLITGLSKREIARREADAGDIFPKGFLLGPHTKRWSLREVEAWQRHVRFAAGAAGQSVCQGESAAKARRRH
jgi:predicted DNA-binding transcriptional regulator AlpA